MSIISPPVALKKKLNIYRIQELHKLKHTNRCLFFPSSFSILDGRGDKAWNRSSWFCLHALFFCCFSSPRLLFLLECSAAPFLQGWSATGVGISGIPRYLNPAYPKVLGYPFSPSFLYIHFHNIFKMTHGGKRKYWKYKFSLLEWPLCHKFTLPLLGIA